MDKIARANLMAAITAHLRAKDRPPWKELQDRFPHVPPATFWRYVKKIRDAEEGEETVSQARRQLAGHVGAVVHSVSSGEVSDPVEARDQLRRLFCDIELLRAYAAPNGVIKNPKLFSQCVGLRDRAIGTVVRCHQVILDQEETAGFYDALVREVAAESPPTAERIARRLHRLKLESECAD